MAEITVKLTEHQALLVVKEFERIADTSEDDGYRLKASQILRRFSKARSRLTLHQSDTPVSGTPQENSND